MDRLRFGKYQATKVHFREMPEWHRKRGRRKFRRSKGRQKPSGAGAACRRPFGRRSEPMVGVSFGGSGDALITGTHKQLSILRSLTWIASKSDMVSEWITPVAK